MSFKSVVVIGAGPVGLLCAIEARQKFVKDVTVIDKRSGYSRGNVPALDDDIRKHFKKIGVSSAMGLEKNSDQVSFSRIEQGLADKAAGLGVKFLTPYSVEGAMGVGEAKGGRFKSTNLVLVESGDAKSGYRPPSNAKRKAIPADLIIVASGGGANNDPLITKKLGFDFEALKAKNYGAYGIFAKGTETDNNVPYDIKPVATGATGIASFQTRFETVDHNYMLTTLTGCSAAEFKMLRQQASKLREVLTSINKTAHMVRGDTLKDVDKAVGAFKITIQRARQMYSDRYPAVMVGDAAVKPHPEKGSGYTTGFRGFEAVAELMHALKKTDRSKDNSIIFHDFNDRYELHVSKKALEGTIAVLANIKNTLKAFEQDMKRYVAETMKSPGAKAYVASFDLDGMARRMWDVFDQHQKDAKKFYDFLTGPQNVIPPFFGPGDTAGSLWARIATSYDAFKDLTREAELLGPRLDRVGRALNL